MVFALVMKPQAIVRYFAEAPKIAHVVVFVLKEYVQQPVLQLNLAFLANSVKKVYAEEGVRRIRIVLMIVLAQLVCVAALVILVETLVALGLNVESQTTELYASVLLVLVEIQLDLVNLSHAAKMKTVKEENHVVKTMCVEILASKEDHVG